MRKRPTNPDGHLLALLGRLRAVAPALLPGNCPPPQPDQTKDVGALLDAAARSVWLNPSADRIWLFLVAVTGRYPDPGEFAETRRQLELQGPVGAVTWLLGSCFRSVKTVSATLRPLELISGGVVVDVNITARSNHHTGIQQVVRRTVPLWDARHDIHLAAWTDNDDALRTISDHERRRVVDWHGIPDGEGIDQPSANDRRPIIAPWRSLIVLTDIAADQSAPRLATLAAHSGNHVVAIGYDLIPLVNPQMLPIGAAMRTALYMSAVKRAKRIGAISTSAAVEFSGFGDMLAAQGLPAPVVIECELPAEQPAEHNERRQNNARPLVLCVGTLEPRKNHAAILHAAEILWRDGLDFELVFVGGAVWGEALQHRIAELVELGRPLTVALRIPQDDLLDYYARARFSVFPSLHEGYGLPVAESLAAGVPVITSDFGSTAEIARGGGTIVVNPRDDGALLAAMRSLLIDDQVLNRLRAQVATRPSRTWDDYAGELWTGMVAPELSALGSTSDATHA